MVCVLLLDNLNTVYNVDASGQVVYSVDVTLANELTTYSVDVATLSNLVTKVYRTNLNEERMDELTLKDSVLTMEIPKKKIVTVELV